MANINKITQELLKELSNGKTSPLQKSQIKSTIYDDGSLKFEFGEKVSKKSKDAAIAWAKKRGLQIVEASLKKSANSAAYIIFSNNNTSLANKKIVKEMIWSN